MPFGPLLEGTERSREGRKKNEEEEEEEKREKREKSEEEEEDEEDEEDKEMSDLVDEKQVKTRNEKCACCDKLIKGQKSCVPEERRRRQERESVLSRMPNESAELKVRVLR